MSSNKIRDTPTVIKVFKGYKLEEIMETDDTGYDNGEATIREEVILDYDREE